MEFRIIITISAENQKIKLVLIGHDTFIILCLRKSNYQLEFPHLSLT